MQALLPSESDYLQMSKYLVLDPKPSDLTMIKTIKVWTGYCCINIRWIVVSWWKTILT